MGQWNCEIYAPLERCSYILFASNSSSAGECRAASTCVSARGVKCLLEPTACSSSSCTRWYWCQRLHAGGDPRLVALFLSLRLVRRALTNGQPLSEVCTARDRGGRGPAKGLEIRGLGLAGHLELARASKVRSSLHLRQTKVYDESEKSTRLKTHGDQKPVSHATSYDPPPPLARLRRPCSPPSGHFVVWLRPKLMHAMTRRLDAVWRGV